MVSEDAEDDEHLPALQKPVLEQAAQVSAEAAWDVGA